MAAFSQFASDLDASTRQLLERGERLTELLKQGQYQPLRVSEQIVRIYAATKGFMDDINPKEITAFEAHLLQTVRAGYSKLLDAIEADGQIKENSETELKKAIEGAKATFSMAAAA